MPDGEPDEKCLTGRSTLPAGPPAAEVGSLGGLTEGPLPVPVTHTNRKGVTYSLCRGTTKLGRRATTSPASLRARRSRPFPKAT